MRRALPFAASLLVADLALADLALADTAVETARRLYEFGRQAHEAGDYTAAITSFEGALKHARRPSVIFATAQAYRRQHTVDRDPAKLRRAMDLYREYVETVKQGERRDEAVRHLGELEVLAARLPAEPTAAEAPAAPAAPTQLYVYTARKRGERVSVDDGPARALPLSLDVTPGTHRVHAEAPGHFPLDTEVVVPEGGQFPLLVDLKARPAQLTVVAPAGSTIVIDGRVVATAPLERPLQLVAGRYELAVGRRGRVPYRERVTLARGEVRRVVLDLPLSKRRKYAWASFAAGAAFAGAGAGFVVVAATHGERVGELGDKRDREGLTTEEALSYNHHRQRAGEFFRYGVLPAFGLTLVCAGVGAWLVYFEDPGVEARPALITPQIGPGQAGATLTLTF